ncbi:MAG: prepilin-type N-terminal cleavage/methylation domain-containing protein [Steroidobacteraceae bacterium]
MTHARYSACGRSFTAERGFSMVEVLVAAVILSIGMLGLAGLQMRTLRNNQSALERGVAVVATHAIADALRGDRVNAAANVFDISLNAADPAGGTYAAAVVAGWRSNLRTELGANAKGAIDCTGNLCLITVQWEEHSNNTAALGTLSIQTSVQI